MDQITRAVLDREKAARRMFINRINADLHERNQRGIPIVNEQNIHGNILYVPCQGPFNEENGRCAPLPTPHAAVHEALHATRGNDTHLRPLPQPRRCCEHHFDQDEALYQDGELLHQARVREGRAREEQAREDQVQDHPELFNTEY